jgi:hypothetical protein
MQVVSSVRSSDSESLVAMADPEELTQLSITTYSVKGVLRELSESGVRLSKLDRAAYMKTPVDQAVWDLAYPGDPPEMNRGVIMFVDDETKGWRLNLSGLLFGMALSTKRDPLEGRRYWIQLARKYGIKGIREQDGSYKLFDSLPIERRRQLHDPALASTSP